MFKSDKNKEKIARKNVLRKAKEPKGEIINGYDFSEKDHYSNIFKNLKNVGFQSSSLGRAVEIVNKMIDNNAFIFLGYTSNMMSCGVRENIHYLVREKKVNVLVTTTGGIEEDFLKCFGNFVLGDFKADGEVLRDKSINRIGNIFVSNNRYVEFEQFIQPILEEMYQDQIDNGKINTPSDLILKMAKKINNEKSVYYQALKNNVKVYCPIISDGAIGDNIYFFKFKHPDFILDITGDVKQFNDLTIGLKKSGVIILGSGVVKHSILNANMLRNGAEYSVYINNSQEFDGSDAGASPDEAVSWGKLIGNDKVKVFGEASILFPILISESFAKR